MSKAIVLARPVSGNTARKLSAVVMSRWCTGWVSGLGSDRVTQIGLSPETLLQLAFGLSLRPQAQQKQRGEREDRQQDQATVAM